MKLNQAKRLATIRWKESYVDHYVVWEDDENGYQVADDEEMETFYAGISPIWHPADEN